MTTDAPRLRASALRTLLLAPAGPLNRLEVVESTASTNDDVVTGLRTAPQLWPDSSLLVAEHQRAGRGRTGRTWVTPPRTSLTCTFVVRPGPTGEGLGWLPLIAGLGVVRALQATAGVPAYLKWPNDVLVAPPGAPVLPGWGGLRKVAGVLCDAVRLPEELAVAVGIGVNVSQREQDLPVPTATSLVLAGARGLDREVLLVALVSALAELSDRWQTGGGQAVASGLAAEVADVCRTLGARVQVDLPGGAVLVGRAVRLAADGALVVAGEDGVEHVVRAGDVTHLRPVG